MDDRLRHAPIVILLSGDPPATRQQSHRADAQQLWRSRLWNARSDADGHGLLIAHCGGAAAKTGNSE